MGLGDDIVNEQKIIGIFGNNFVVRSKTSPDSFLRNYGEENDEDDWGMTSLPNCHRFKNKQDAENAARLYNGRTEIVRVSDL